MEKANLRADYLHHLSRGAFDSESLKSIATYADGLSFAQLRESYILAAQLVMSHALMSGLSICGLGCTLLVVEWRL